MAPVIAPCDRANLPPAYGAFVQQNEKLYINVLSTWAHAPSTINLAVLWGQAQFTSLALSPTMRELVIVLTGVAVKSDYELAQHLPMAKGVGCSDKQLVAILKHGADEAYYRSSAADGLFDERERVLLAWITLVAKSPNVPDETMVEVKRHFSDREMTEALTVHGWYYMVGRITTVLKIDIDEVDGVDVLAAFSNVGNVGR